MSTKRTVRSYNERITITDADENNEASVRLFVRVDDDGDFYIEDSAETYSETTTSIYVPRRMATALAAALVRATKF